MQQRLNETELHTTKRMTLPNIVKKRSWTLKSLYCTIPSIKSIERGKTGPLITEDTIGATFVGSGERGVTGEKGARRSLLGTGN